MSAPERPERNSARANTRINLEQSRKQAKDLVKAFQNGDAKTLERIRWNHPQFRRLTEQEFKAREFALADAQLVIAREHHIESWPKLLLHVQSIENADPAISRFENAAGAIIDGDLDSLRAMLRDHPDLIRERSSRAHQSTLLHYVSANGVENYRQITPANIVEITRFLLDASAEVNAASNAYGGGSTTLGLVATSAHPRLAGVQLALIDLLVERGANIGPIDANGSLVHGCLANGCPEAAVHLIKIGANADNIYGAAGLGRLDAVQRLFSQASPKQLDSALIVAAMCEHRSVVEYLLDNNADVAASNGMTALHWAAANGDVPMVNLLLVRGAQLEALNEFGGTVLSSTLWFAYHARPADFAARNYPAVFDRLIAAGGRTDSYPDMQRDIDGVYKHAASRETSE